MFAGKIHSAARSRLLSHLVPLYTEGYKCLLRCSSIQLQFYAIIQQPLLANMTEMTEESEKCHFDVELILEVWNNKPSFYKEISELAKQKHDLHNIILINDAEFEQEILQLWKDYCIQNLSIISYIRISVGVDEAGDHSRQSRMTNMPVVDATRHLLYTALYHYLREMYSDAISQLEEAKIKLQASSFIVTREDGR